MLSFSIIIPTLEESARIGSLLNALGRQGYAGQFEVIVVDGGSTDNTRQMVQKRPEVRLLETECGTSRQRNAGASLATGEMLVFMDADNLPHGDFLSDIARSYRRLPFSIACPWFYARDCGPVVRMLYGFFNILFFLGQGWLRTGSGVCLIVRRDVFEKIGGFDEALHLGEDVNLIRRASRYGLHRHLLVPLQTSGRRFAEKGVWRLMFFYARITPHILLGRWRALQKFEYEAAPYRQRRDS